MDISAGIKASLAGRYASALFDLASENGTVTPVESDLETLGAALTESADLAALTTNPELARDVQGKAIAAAQRGEVTATVTSAHRPPAQLRSACDPEDQADGTRERCWIFAVGRR